MLSDCKILERQEKLLIIIEVTSRFVLRIPDLDKIVATGLPPLVQAERDCPGKSNVDVLKLG